MSAAPSRTYLTKQGDVVDAIALQAYGTKIGTAELLLDANPGLGARGAVLDEGITLVLPALPPRFAATRPTVNLWD